MSQRQIHSKIANDVTIATYQAQMWQEELDRRRQANQTGEEAERQRLSEIAAQHKVVDPTTAERLREDVLQLREAAEMGQSEGGGAKNYNAK